VIKEPDIGRAEYAIRPIGERRVGDQSNGSDTAWKTLFTVGFAG
jgi:hypothetical protein